MSFAKDFAPRKRQIPSLLRSNEVNEVDTTVTVVLVPALHTRVPRPTNSAILFQDHKPALGVRIEIESGKGDSGQP